MNNLRFAVASKIAVGLGAILVIGMLAMLLIYRNLVIVKRDVQTLADIEQPTSLAAYEMEINVNGMGLAVLKYLDDADPFYRAKVSVDRTDFNAFHDEYSKLANTPQEQRLSGEMGALFSQFEKLAQSLMEKKDQQTALFQAATASLEDMDRIIDERIQPAIDRRSPDALAKIEASMNMGSDIAELGFWTTVYQEDSSQQHRAAVFDKDQEVKDSLARLSRLDFSQGAADAVKAVQAIADQTGPEIHAIVALEDDLDGGTTRFTDLRSEMDNRLDDEIQILALDDLTVPRQEADQAAENALLITVYLIPVYILVAIAVGWLLIRVINRPLTKLKDGTEAIASGNLDHRIELRSRDEFGDLASHFNHMVGQLQATTVSKASLMASEKKLHLTVGDLRREIAERERAERERAELETELRRTESMSAMGALVAGVAHEVRNPLFGISSTLDAMHVRFKDREDVQRYIGVLRKEAERLSMLMGELLDYGKPPALELAPGSFEDAVAQAIQRCMPLAAQMRVEIVSRVSTDLAAMPMDRMRLSQVIQNLLQNAIQHSSSGSTVRLEAEELVADGTRWISCRIEDSGAGLAAGDLERIFDPFFTRRRGGTGLGLAIVRRIVEQHGGRIAAANRPDGGAIMTVRLPSAREVPAPA